MENSELQEKWPIIRKKIKEVYPHITDEDLDYEFGQESDLMLRLQKKLGKTNKEIRDWLSLLG